MGRPCLWWEWEIFRPWDGINTHSAVCGTGPDGFERGMSRSGSWCRNGDAAHGAGHCGGCGGETRTRVSW